MWTLGINTCTDSTGIALLMDDRVISKSSASLSRTQLTWVVPAIRRSIEDAGIDHKALDLIAITSGPGSFTGLRLGIVTVKTMAQILDIPIVDLNTLDAISLNGENLPDGLIAPTMDGRKKQVFTAVFAKSRGRIERESEYLALSIEEFQDYISSLPAAPFVFGSALGRYGEEIRELNDKVKIIGDQALWEPDPERIARKGRDLYLAGKRKNYLDLVPFYLRPPDIQKNLKKLEPLR